MRLLTYKHERLDISGSWNSDTSQSQLWFPHRPLETDRDQCVWFKRRAILAHSISKLATNIEIEMFRPFALPVVTAGPHIVAIETDNVEASAPFAYVLSELGPAEGEQTVDIDHAQHRLAQIGESIAKVFQPVFVKS